MIKWKAKRRNQAWVISLILALLVWQLVLQPFNKKDDYKQINSTILQVPPDSNKASDPDKSVTSDIARSAAAAQSINIKSYGAVGDGRHDDTSAIKTAIKDVPTNGTLYFPAAAGYKTTGTITISKAINVIMDAPIVYYGSNSAVQVGIENTYLYGKSFKLDVKRYTVSDWRSEACIGIKIINLEQCDIMIVNAIGFTIGVQTIGSNNHGFQDNKLELYLINNNKIAVDLTTESRGWNNDNAFYGGRINTWSHVNAGKSRYGIRITSKDGTYTNNNNNLFLKPDFELINKDALPGEAIPILIEHGNRTRFVQTRNEGNSIIVARISNYSFSNVIELGYTDNADSYIEDNSTARSNVLTTIFNAYLENTRLLYKVDNVWANATPHDAIYPNSTHIMGLNIRDGNSNNAWASSLPIGTDYVETTSKGLGVFLDTTEIKRFIIGGSRKPGYGGRAYFICYDQNGTQLTGNNDYINGAFINIGYSEGNFGGSYYTYTDSNDRIFFTVADAVKKLWVGFCGGDKPCRLMSFELSTPISTGNAYIDLFPNTVETKRMATQAPVKGIWKKGDIVYNDSPTAGGFTGWICIAAGTPGTWKGFGVIEP